MTALRTIIMVGSGAILGVFCAVYWPWSKEQKHDTAFLIKKAALAVRSNVHLYSPAVLQGTLYVMAPVSALIAMTLREWKAMDVVTDIDVRILWATCVSVAMSNWLAFVSKRWGEVQASKNKRDKKLDDATDPPAPSTDPNLR
jgi:hypothetical protein